MGCFGRLLAAMAIVISAGCGTEDPGVPGPATIAVADGSAVWRVQNQDCPDDCPFAVYINRWSYSIDCASLTVPDEDLGETFALSDLPYLEEARTVIGLDPTTLALHVTGSCAGPRWILAEGEFYSWAIDDPPDTPTQQRATPD